MVWWDRKKKKTEALLFVCAWSGMLRVDQYDPKNIDILSLLENFIMQSFLFKVYSKSFNDYISYPISGRLFLSISGVTGFFCKATSEEQNDWSLRFLTCE